MVNKVAFKGIGKEEERIGIQSLLVQLRMHLMNTLSNKILRLV